MSYLCSNAAVACLSNSESNKNFYHSYKYNCNSTEDLSRMNNYSSVRFICPLTLVVIEHRSHA